MTGRVAVGSGVILGVVLCSCVVIPPTRESVDAGIGERTGSGLGPERAAGEIGMPPGVRMDDGLSREEAVAIALWNNAAFLEALSELGMARADLVEAGQLPNPTLGLLFPYGPKQLEFVVRFPAEAIWLRPARIKVATVDAEKVAHKLVQSGLDLARDVRVAYADLLAANATMGLAEEAVEIANGMLEIAEARVSAGEASKLEAVTAESDVREAKRTAASAPFDATRAREKLGHLLGVPVPEGAVAGVVGRTLSLIPASVDGLVEGALAARPDLRAAELALEAEGRRAGIEEVRIANFKAVFDANGDASVFEAGPGVDQLEIPIFNQNQAGKIRAKAKVETAARHYLTVKDLVIFEVREAYVRAKQAREEALAWKSEMVPPLRDAEGLARTAYKAGEVSFLQVLETTRKLTAARLREAETEASFERAMAELERSAGYRLGTAN